MVDVLLPELGEGVEKATIACYHHNVGDTIKKNDDVVEVVTDKATFNVPATSDGIIKELCFMEGDEAPIGSVLFKLEPGH
ncbi:MAG: biotin/lipoyl-containing protein [Candidatus Omnitrophota bacterium]